MNAYQILQISTSATQDDIKKAFRNLAHKHHPDKGGSAEKFKEINKAYTEINTKEKQGKYDVQHGLTRASTTYSTFEALRREFEGMSSQQTAGDIFFREVMRQKMNRQPKPEYYYNGTRWIYGVNPNKRQ